MSSRKLTSLYSFFIGVTMLATWIYLALSGRVPDLTTEPLYYVYFLGAELLTIITIIIGGFAVFSESKWGKQLHFFSIGMLLYSCLIILAHWMLCKDWAMVTLVIRFTVFALLFIGLLVFKSDAGEKENNSSED
jgi:heme A synthase